MTDQRARAEQHVEKRMNALLLYQELLTDSPPDAVTRIVAALADERRRVWEDAAGIAEMFSINKQQIHPDIAWDNMSESARTVCHMTCQNIALAIRAKAHAGQEG